MGQRLQLQTLLESFETPVYFQPPANVQMVYPCIRYSRDNTDVLFADNNPYRLVKRYEVMVITDDPDSDLPDRVAALPMCRHDRSYPAENLNHYVFTLYF